VRGHGPEHSTGSHQQRRRRKWSWCSAETHPTNALCPELGCSVAGQAEQVAGPLARPGAWPQQDTRLGVGQEPFGQALLFAPS